LPIQVIRRRIVGIEVSEAAPSHRWVKVTSSFHILVNRRGRAESRPDGDHDMKILLVKNINHFLRVWIPCLVKEHAAPVGVATPIIPVLNDVIDWNPAFAVLLRDTQKLIAIRIMLLALPVTIRP